MSNQQRMQEYLQDAVVKLLASPGEHFEANHGAGRARNGPTVARIEEPAHSVSRYKSAREYV